MSVSRRQVLGGAAVIGAAGAIGVHRMAGRGKAPELILYDSRKPASLTLARGQPGVRQLNLANAATWSDIRRAQLKGPVSGLTSWNDYVSARQWLEEKGLRVAAESHDRKQDLIAWTMA
jgi:hypothetical protein